MYKNNYSAFIFESIKAEELVYQYLSQGLTEGEEISVAPNQYKFDFLIKGEIKTAIEVKYRSRPPSSVEMNYWLEKLNAIVLDTDIDEGTLYINELPAKWNKEENDKNFFKINIKTYNIEDIEEKLKKPSFHDESVRLINELGCIEAGKKYATKYEGWAVECVNFVFKGRLSNLGEQKKLNDGLIRADYVTRIIFDPKYNGFWRFLVDQFASRYVVFEFKNYTEKITQAEILTTEKYLYKNAARRLAFILSREGEDNNALKTRSGAMREDGKLILTFSDRDMLELLEFKKVGDEEGMEEFLYKMVDGFLLNLGR